MPLWTLPALPTQWESQRATTATASWQSTTVTPNASANIKGNWAQVDASLLRDTTLLVIRGNGATSTGVARPMLLDIGIGGSGSEAVFLADLDIGFHTAGTTWDVPCNLAAGTRVAARCQSGNTTTLSISIDSYGSGTILGGSPGVAKWTTYGTTSSGASTGTAVTPGNTNTWGSWTSLGTTSGDHDVWLFGPSMGANSATTSISYRTQIAFAPNTTAATACVTAGSHLEGPWFSLSTSEALTRFDMSPHAAVFNPVPSGTVIYARASASGTAQTIYLSAYGGNL